MGENSNFNFCILDPSEVHVKGNFFSLRENRHFLVNLSNSSGKDRCNQMGREALEGLCVSPKPAASRKINKGINSHPIRCACKGLLSLKVIVMEELETS